MNANIINLSLLSARKKPPENVCSVFCNNKVVEFIDLTNVLRDPEIVPTLLSTLKKFSIPSLSYKLGLPVSLTWIRLNIAF